MLDYDGIKSLAKSIGRPITDLLALSDENDPFFAGVGHRGLAARWFARIWETYGGTGAHLRRIHYRIVMRPEGVSPTLPGGREYQKTKKDWDYLCRASLAARFLQLVPPDAILDQRNDEPMFFAAPLRRAGEASCWVVAGGPYIDVPDMPVLPFFSINGFDHVGQDCIVEVWIEKSTQNDWLVPLCQSRRVNLAVGIGEQSETRSRELALRAHQTGAPIRIIYISDFDPAGRSMPKAVARKVEYTIVKRGLDVDLQLIPLALTPEQCREYNLPRTPIKDTDRRKTKFEETFGVGATELDAMEALHPGMLRSLLNAEIDNFLDPHLNRRIWSAESDVNVHLGRMKAQIKERHTEELAAVEADFSKITAELRAWRDRASTLWQTMAEELEDVRPDLSGMEIPRSEAPGETDRFVLFDSRRDYLTQRDFYNAWRDGAETNGSMSE